MVLLTSTRASAHANTDQFSDYDVILYVADTTPFAKDSEWLAGFGRVLVRFQDEGQDHGLRHYARLVIYEDGTKIDFTIAPVEQLDRIAHAGTLPDALDVGYRVLLDKDGKAANLRQPTYAAHIPRRPTQQEFLAVVEEFWWETTYVARNLRRDELLPAKYSLEVVMKLDLLRRVLEWRIETEHDWSLKPGVLGKGFKKHLDGATWSELEGTFVGADIAQNWQALFGTTQLFRRVASEVAVRLGLAYPHDLDAQVTGYLQRVKASSPTLA